MVMFHVVYEPKSILIFSVFHSLVITPIDKLKSSGKLSIGRELNTGCYVVPPVFSFIGSLAMGNHRNTDSQSMTPDPSALGVTIKVVSI